MNAEPATPVEAIYHTPEFRRLSNGRRTMRIALMAVAMAFFFSQPLLFSAFPAVFRMPLAGSINVGLAYLVAQYAVGGLVAVLYAVCQRRFDRRVAEIVGRSGHAAPAAAESAPTADAASLRSA